MADQTFATALAAAPNGHNDLKLTAAALGIDWKALFRCLVRAIGLKAVIAAIVSGDFMAALAGVDWEKVLECVAGE